jgi:hypothetical protein
MKKLAYSAWLAILCVAPLLAAGTAGAEVGQAQSPPGGAEIVGSVTGRSAPSTGQQDLGRPTVNSGVFAQCGPNCGACWHRCQVQFDTCVTDSGQPPDYNRCVNQVLKPCQKTCPTD